MQMIKHKNWVSKIILPVMAALMCWATVGLGQPEEVFLDHADVLKKKQRVGVNFFHEKHMESFECLDCHHRYEKGENVLEESELEEGAKNISCATCHNDEADTDLKQAFHQQCMGCHLKQRKQGKSSGPELCGQCHLKK